MKPKLFLGIILLILSLAIVNIAGFDKEIKNAFFIVSSPVQNFFWWQGEKFQDFLNTLKEIKYLKEENQGLELQNQKLEAENIRLQELKKENETLRQSLDLGLEKEFKLQMAEIIAKDPFEDTILINKGAKSGIIEGMPVITPQKILIGRVAEASPDFSRIMLISNKKITFGGKIVNSLSEEITGVVKGKNGLKMAFDLVPSDKIISQGEKVITASIEGIFPKGLLIGYVKNVTKLDAAPFQQIEINPAFNLSKLNILFVITGYGGQ